MKWKVEVSSKFGGWVLHSMWESYREAVDQADMVHGRVKCQTGLLDYDAWKWAVRNQGFTGSYENWSAQDDDERIDYEIGANGIGTK